MANNTEVIFENIEQRILKEISEARYAIFVSVAWFTNKRLFNALLEQAKNNCYVSIIIQLDEINSQSGIDFSQILIGRSECFKISKDAELLHDKFCIIDFKRVITGSYNWTYKAAQNSENILIVDDPSLATQYITRFEQQKARFKDSSILQKSVPPINLNKPKPTTGTHKGIVIQESPKVQYCSHCKKEIGYNEGYCKHCGEHQKGHIKKIVVTCRKCMHKQEEILIDAINTKFCTSCGSDKLKWELVNN